MKASAPAHSSIQRSVVIRASAGTGKTFRLAMRYIGLLARGEPPSSLLATTFTKKAAGEMLERVLRLLAKGARDNTALAELREHADSSLTKSRCTELLKLMIANLHWHNVLNIDKLFLRIASGFSLELGIAPGWKLVDPQDESALQVESLASLLAAAPPSETLPTLIDLAQGGNPSQVHTPVLASLRSAYFHYLSARRAFEPWERIQPSGSPLSGPPLDAAIHKLQACFRFVPNTKEGKPAKRFVDAIEAASDALAAGNLRAFLENGLAPKLCATPPEQFDRRDIPAQIRDVYLPLIAHAFSVLRSELASRNAALYRLLRSFEAHYAEIKSTRGTYLFGDVPQLLLDLPYEGARDHLYFKLDARIRHILLDEFQDISLQQFELLEPLITECLSGDEGRTSFVVGDVKQSLYGWRGAEPELLGQLGERLSLPVEDLSRNFRSSPIIINAVNNVFRSLASNPAFAEKGLDAARAWQAGFKTHYAFKEKLPGRVMLTVSGEPPQDSDLSVQDMLLLQTADRVKRLAAAAPSARIAILVRTNKWISPLRFELSQRGIDSSEEGGSPLTDSPATCAVLSLFHVAAHPGDTVARYHIAKSPVGRVVGMTDHSSDVQAMRVSRRIRSQLVRRGAVPLLLNLRRRLLPQLTARDHSRLSQLVALAATFDAGDSRDAAVFHEFASTRSVEDPSPASVRIMSIHKAKGLEFDAVFLPQFDGPWSIKGQGVLADRSTPYDRPSLLTMPPPSELGDLDPELSRLKDARYQRLITEELCCLYVGMTRAIHHLEMIVSPAAPEANEGGSPSAAKVLCNALAPGRARKPDSMLFSEGDNSWFPSKPEETPMLFSSPKPPSLKLATSRDRSDTHLARVSPSLLHAEPGLPAEDLLAPPNTRALDRGTLLHAWFELIEWTHSQPPTDEALIARARREGLSLTSGCKELADFRAILSQEATRKALSQPSPQWRVKREWSFTVRHAESSLPTLLSGRFDRVHIRYDGGRPIEAHILDFKTDAFDASSLDDIADSYRPQMNAYRSALSSLLRIEKHLIGASLIFVNGGVVIDVGST